MDRLDLLLREMTFKDNWRTVAIREGIVKGILIASIFSILLVSFLSLVFINYTQQIAQEKCLTAFA